MYKLVKKENEIIALSPAQQTAFATLLRALGAGNVVLLKGRACSGRTTILQKAQAVTGAALLGMRQFMGSLSGKPPFALEEAFQQMIQRALDTCDVALI